MIKLMTDDICDSCPLFSAKIVKKTIVRCVSSEPELITTIHCEHHEVCSSIREYIKAGKIDIGKI